MINYCWTPDVPDSCNRETSNKIQGEPETRCSYNKARHSLTKAENKKDSRNIRASSNLRFFWQPPCLSPQDRVTYPLSTSFYSFKSTTNWCPKSCNETLYSKTDLNDDYDDNSTIQSCKCIPAKWSDAFCHPNETQCLIDDDSSFIRACQAVILKCEELQKNTLRNCESSNNKIFYCVSSSLDEDRSDVKSKSQSFVKPQPDPARARKRTSTKRDFALINITPRPKLNICIQSSLSYCTSATNNQKSVVKGKYAAKSPKNIINKSQSKNFCKDNEKSLKSESNETQSVLQATGDKVKEEITSKPFTEVLILKPEPSKDPEQKPSGKVSGKSQNTDSSLNCCKNNNESSCCKPQDNQQDIIQSYDDKDKKDIAVKPSIELNTESQEHKQEKEISPDSSNENKNKAEKVHHISNKECDAIRKDPIQEYHNENKEIESKQKYLQPVVTQVYKAQDETQLPDDSKNMSSESVIECESNDNITRSSSVPTLDIFINKQSDNLNKNKEIEDKGKNEEKEGKEKKEEKEEEGKKGEKEEKAEKEQKEVDCCDFSKDNKDKSDTNKKVPHCCAHDILAIENQLSFDDITLIPVKAAPIPNILKNLGQDCCKRHSERTVLSLKDETFILDWYDPSKKINDDEPHKLAFEEIASFFNTDINLTNEANEKAPMQNDLQFTREENVPPDEEGTVKIIICCANGPSKPEKVKTINVKGDKEDRPAFKCCPCEENKSTPSEEDGDKWPEADKEIVVAHYILDQPSNHKEDQKIGNNRSTPCDIETCNKLSQEKLKPCDMKICNKLSQGKLKRCDIETYNKPLQEKLKPCDIETCDKLSQKKLKPCDIETSDKLSQKKLKPCNINTCDKLSRKKPRTCDTNTCDNIPRKKWKSCCNDRICPINDPTTSTYQFLLKTRLCCNKKACQLAAQICDVYEPMVHIDMTVPDELGDSQYHFLAKDAETTYETTYENTYENTYETTYETAYNTQGTTPPETGQAREHLESTVMLYELGTNDDERESVFVNPEPDGPKERRASTVSWSLPPISAMDPDPVRPQDIESHDSSYASEGESVHDSPHNSDSEADLDDDPAVSASVEQVIAAATAEANKFRQAPKAVTKSAVFEVRRQKGSEYEPRELTNKRMESDNTLYKSQIDTQINKGDEKRRFNWCSKLKQFLRKKKTKMPIKEIDGNRRGSTDSDRRRPNVAEPVAEKTQQINHLLNRM